MNLFSPTDQNGKEIDKIAIRLLELFPIVILIVSTVGAQMTFSIILSDIANPTLASFDKETVLCLISISWLLFTFAIFASFAAAVLLIFHGDDVRSGLVSRNKLLMLMGIAVLIILEITTFGAFICLGLAVAAYVEIVGWAAVGCITLAALVTFAATVAYLVHFRNGESLNLYKCLNLANCMLQQFARS
jgi:hypothetical protein